MHDAIETRSLRVLVVDDEPLARERLRALLSQVHGCEVAGCAGDGESALADVDALAPDVVLLDIMMPGLDGLETARRLSGVAVPPAIVFVTAHGAHGVDAFDLNAVDYVVKPVRLERLELALQRARQFLAGRRLTGGDGTRTHLSSRTRGGVRRIALGDVLYLQADEKYVTVHHPDGELLIEDTLKALEDEFPDRLLRIHRNCLVARTALVELRREPDGRGWAVLRGVPQPLEISRRCLPAVREALRQD